MARIILNVELNNTKVPAGIKELRNQIASLGEAFGKIQNAKAVTDSIKALTDQYTALAKAATEVAKVSKKQADEETELRNKYLDLEKQFASFIEKVNKAGEKNKEYAQAMAGVKKEIQDAWAALRDYNKGETDAIGTTDVWTSPILSDRSISTHPREL